MHLRKIKKTAYVALSLLLVSLTLLITASYAWFSMSKMPEISGIETNIGSNGSLEIALLSDLTYMDPSLIRSRIGDSVVVQDATISNLSWGNLIDLKDESYGLDKITLLPSRLNITPGEAEKGIVGSSVLTIPNFSADGRTEGFLSDTISAIFFEDEFTYVTDNQNYGVRGIGTVSDMTSQQAALAGARAAIQSYRSASISAAESMWKANGAAVIDICHRRYSTGEDVFSAADVAVLRDSATRLLGALSYMDSALRQGIIGYAATVIDEEESFKSLRSVIENTAIPLSMILSSVQTELPSGFKNWINIVDSNKVSMQEVIIACDSLRGDSYTWAQISPIINRLIDANEAYLGEDKLSSANAYIKLTVDNVLTLSPNAGILADIADFSGNYNTFFKYTDSCNIEVKTSSTMETPHLTEIATILEDREAAAGNASIKGVALNTIYGYAIDLAFRCNTRSDLLLQTMETLRVEGDSENPQMQGNGSFMRFASEQLSTEQIVLMMDAIRIAFLDNKNTLLGIAKLNTSNYEEKQEGIEAPLYLYDHKVSIDGSISMGERQTENHQIMELSEDTATVMTIVIWLDGDHVDNSLAAYTAQSMSGMLNLQFASSAELDSADISVEDIK